MAERDAKATVPEVRFPEFVDAQNWSVAPMRKLYAFMRNNLLSRDKLNYERGVAKNIHYGDIHTKFQALFDITRESVPFINESESVPGADSEDYCVEGDLIFADASEDMRDVGKCIEVIRLAGERLLSGQHTILARPKDDALVIGFGGHLFRSGLMRSRIEKEAQGTKVYQISSSRLGGIDITYPSGKGEQQKIADCLTSLDEVIAAQGRKVEALKAHKRGLMQQLFPREGETRPRLRFPEFRDAPEWEVEPLAYYVASLDAGVSVNSGDRPACGDQVGVLKTSCVANGVFDSQENKVVQDLSEIERVKEPVRANTILISRMNTIALVGANAFVEKDAPNLFLPDRLWAAKVTPKGHARFLAYVLGSERGRAALSGLASGSSGTMKNIGKAEVLALQIYAPSLPEQQRIADCLSSLDTQIAAESRQLAALKAHKQGLMQQLFPVASEVA